MNQNIEIEFKNLLTKEEFLLLQQELNVTKKDFIMQTNYYFDTKEFHLKNNMCALRIREKQNNYTMTLKQPNDVGLLETNIPLTKETAEKIFKDFSAAPKSIKLHLQSMDIPFEKLYLLGALHTSRCEVNTNEALIVLDESTYGQKNDFELEMEVTDEVAGKKFFLQFLKNHKIPIRKTDNKVKRFLNEVL